MKVHCNKCSYTIEQDDKRTVGCLCDSDAPTWIGITPQGRLLHMSHGSYEVLSGE
jgi:hypothetical protein